MQKFCGKCGAPINPQTGSCTKCGNTPSRPPEKNGGQFDIEQVRMQQKLQQEQEKAKQKAEKKQAWNEAKKRYKGDLKKKKQILKAAKKEKRAALPTKKKIGNFMIKVGIILMILALLAGGIYFGLKSLGLFADEKEKSEGENNQTSSSQGESEERGGSLDVYKPPEDDMPSEFEIPSVDTDKYYGEAAESVTKIDASTAGRTQEQAYKNLTDRGFSQQPIFTEYDMGGKYLGASEISSTGTSKHPVYYTYYTAASGDIWLIYEINGVVIASSLSYKVNYSGETEVLVSETENLMSYDGESNKFYNTKPKDSSVRVKVVAKIDAAVLDQLTTQELRN